MTRWKYDIFCVIFAGITASVTTGASYTTERQYVRSSVFTATESKEILNLHNQFRGAVSPNAAHMQYMTWSQQLADAAQIWADGCSGTRGLPNSLTSVTGPRPGQTIWTGHGPHSVAGTISDWFIEGQYFTYSNHSCSGHCDNYVQLVWDEASSVGCGWQNCSGQGQGQFFVCYYSSGANLSAAPYVAGPSCSLCSPNHCSENLCVTSPEAQGLTSSNSSTTQSPSGGGDNNPLPISGAALFGIILACLIVFLAVPGIVLYCFCLCKNKNKVDPDEEEGEEEEEGDDGKGDDNFKSVVSDSMNDSEVSLTQTVSSSASRPMSSTRALYKKQISVNESLENGRMSRMSHNGDVLSNGEPYSVKAGLKETTKCITLIHRNDKIKLGSFDMFGLTEGSDKLRTLAVDSNFLESEPNGHLPPLRNARHLPGGQLPPIRGNVRRAAVQNNNVEKHEEMKEEKDEESITE